MDRAFRTLVEELDAMPPRLDALRRMIHQAILICEHDPSMALTRARKALEYIARRVYKSRVGKPPGTQPLENLLQAIARDGHWPGRLAPYATIVREFGNVGTHSQVEEVGRDDVVRCIESLLVIVNWFADQEEVSDLG